MDDLKASSNILRVVAVMLGDSAGQHYALELVKAAQVKVGSIYAILAKLEQHQWVTSDLETIDPSVAGRPPRRYYRLTAKGVQAARVELAATQRALTIGGAYA